MKGHTGYCAPCDIPIVVKHDDKYRLLQPFEKFVIEIRAAAAGTLRCAVLNSASIAPHEIKTIRLLKCVLPSSPLYTSLPSAVEDLSKYHDAIDWLRSSYGHQTSRNSGYPALFKLVLGGFAISKRTIQRYLPREAAKTSDPTTPQYSDDAKKAIACWNRIAKQTGGMTFEQLLETIPPHRRATYSEKMVKKIIKDLSFTFFFHDG